MDFQFDNNIPIYVQIVEQLKNYIMSGKIKCGEKLPSVRDLALNIKVNPNTIQKALSELESEGLIYTERTNGKFVTSNKELISKLKNKLADEISNKYFKNMESIGFDKKSALNHLKNIGGDK